MNKFEITKERLTNFLFEGAVSAIVLGLGFKILLVPPYIIYFFAVVVMLFITTYFMFFELNIKRVDKYLYRSVLMYLYLLLLSFASYLDLILYNS